MTKDEALKQALEALENISTALREDDVLGSDSELMLNAITAIKEALAQPDEDAIIIQYHEATIKILEKRIEELTSQPEPVTSGWSLRYVYFDENGIPLAHREPEQEPAARVIDNGTPEGATEWIPFTSRVEPLKTGDLLYTTPPQRPWVGLTEVDILAASKHWRHAEDFMAGVYWASGTLKEKNTCQE